MTCPRCGCVEAGTVECSRCGVVFAKLNRAPPPATETGMLATSSGSSLRSGAHDWLHWMGMAGFATGIVAIWFYAAAPPPTPPRPVSTPAPLIVAAVTPSAAAVETPGGVVEPSHTAPGPPAAPMPMRAVDVPRLGTADADALDPADREVLNRLIEPRGPAESDLGAAEELFRKYPASVRVRNTLVNLLFTAGYQAQREGRSRQAISFLERATQVAPDLPPTWERLLNAHIEAYAWSECERVARAALRAHSDKREVCSGRACADARGGTDAGRRALE